VWVFVTFHQRMDIGATNHGVQLVIALHKLFIPFKKLY